MLSNIDANHRVSGGRLSVPEALDKVLIHDSPVSKTPCRFVTNDTILEGQTAGSGRKLRAGDAVICDVAEASRSVHRDADPIWDSTNRSTLSFGAGVHACPARYPARIIVETAVNRGFRRLPALKLAVPADQITYGSSPWTSSAPAMPVTFQPTNPDEWT